MFITWDFMSNVPKFPTAGNPFGYAFGTLRERQLPAEGNPPAALVSPPAGLLSTLRFVVESLKSALNLELLNPSPL
jgi:hypothetical protein